MNYIITFSEKYPFEVRKLKKEFSQRRKGTKNTKLLFDIF